MDRRDPYIGDGLPRSDDELQRHRPGARSGAGWIVAALLIAAIAVAAWYFLWRDRAPPPPPPAASVVPAAPALPTAQAPQHPVDSPTAEQPLPELKASDGAVAAALSALMGLDAFGRTFVTENLVRNIVATVDNLPREQVSQRVNPVRAVSGLPVTQGKGEALTLSPANSARYAAYVRAMEAVPTSELVAFYRRHYPLFQQAYVELGYPNGYFNDRLVEVIDHLLETPDPAAPIRLKQPKVLFEYADPALEERSAGQKALIRIGKENRDRVKSKLREIRAAITAR